MLKLKVHDTLKVEASLSSYKDTTGFAVGRVECITCLFFVLSIDANIVDESNEIVARLPSIIVIGMITVNSHDNRTIWDMNSSYLGGLKPMRRVWYPSIIFTV